MKHGAAFVSGKDWEWTSTQVPADDAGVIETMKATARQVAAIYGVPPEMIGGETGSSLTSSTVEQNLLNFATLTLRPPGWRRGCRRCCRAVSGSGATST